VKTIVITAVVSVIVSATLTTLVIGLLQQNAEARNLIQRELIAFMEANRDIRHHMFALESEEEAESFLMDVLPGQLSGNIRNISVSFEFLEDMPDTLRYRDPSLLISTRTIYINGSRAGSFSTIYPYP
jgi:hypothetical protein